MHRWTLTQIQNVSKYPVLAFGNSSTHTSNIMWKCHPQWRDIAMDIQLIPLDALLDVVESCRNVISQAAFHKFPHSSLGRLHVTGVSLEVIKRGRESPFCSMAVLRQCLELTFHMVMILDGAPHFWPIRGRLAVEHTQVLFRVPEPSFCVCEGLCALPVQSFKMLLNSNHNPFVLCTPILVEKLPLTTL